jgi:IclR family transcriptional regulator, acetate operon repressor
VTQSAPYPGTQTVRRAVALLKLFADDKPEWSLSELARSAGLNKTTAYRLLQALEVEGMLTRSPQSDAYRLGPAAISLGGRALRSNDLRAASHTDLIALAEATHETATFEVLAENQVLILDEVSGSHVVGNIQSLGTRWPLHATSTGKVLLAHMSEQQLEALLAAGLPRLTARTITAPDALMRDLEQVRRQGYAIVVEELEDGFVAIGAPVRNFTGEVIAAISVGGPAMRLTAKRLPELAGYVCRAAAQISQRLGF